MSKSTQLRMVPLKLPQIGLRAFQDRLIAVKLDFLLWGWNYVCPDMGSLPQKRSDGTSATLAAAPNNVHHFLASVFRGAHIGRSSGPLDAEDTPTSTPPAQQDAGRDASAARVPRKRRWREEPEKEQHQDSAALKRKRPVHELCSRQKRKARRLVLPASSAETARAAGEEETPSSEEDGNARTTEGSGARTPSAEVRRPSGQERQHAARMSVPPTDRRIPADGSTPAHRRDSPPVQRRKGKEPAEDPPSAQGPSGQGPSAVRPPGNAPSAQGPSGHRVTSTEPAENAPSVKSPLEAAPLAEGPSG
ncbi:hypothetical protein AXG93_136s1010 [Marchantia polymorpha subsp. ruderalis]|uniref:Uncharacterized protein n=1 Tax=Marchantia polymorpha subsp. ruderalis TaxID=1480154 RepID=A0A176W7H5_MARPO|nr:hypothetical protein AXG93_136s1010 [Marchantia polymorpha subsp. ruderalis]